MCVIGKAVLRAEMSYLQASCIIATNKQVQQMFNESVNKFYNFFLTIPGSGIIAIFTMSANKLT